VRRTPEPEFRTKRCNQWVSRASTWLPYGAWARCTDPQPIEEYAEVILGFDGSFSNDSTALVAVQVGDVPHVDVVECWEKPPGADNGWRVPIADVEEAIREACRRYSVREIVCDPFRWARTYQTLEAEGLPIVEFPQSPSRMVPATQRFYEAVLNGGLTHSGDPRLARHMDNCTLKVDARGARLAKDAKNSPRKIDLAVASVMAFDRACIPAEAVPESVVNTLVEILGFICIAAFAWFVWPPLVLLVAGLLLVLWANVRAVRPRRDRKERADLRQVA
jgi:phage terminase large subunit-like protein